MKKTFFAIAAVAALAMGCAKEQQPSDAPADLSGVTTIKVTVDQTKVAVNEKTGACTWQEGDQLAVWYQNDEDNATGKKVIFTYKGLLEDGSAEFTTTEDVAGHTAVKVTYPADCLNDQGGWGLIREWNYKEGFIPMYARTDKVTVNDDGSLSAQLNHNASVFKFTLHDIPAYAAGFVLEAVKYNKNEAGEFVDADENVIDKENATPSQTIAIKTSFPYKTGYTADPADNSNDITLYSVAAHGSYLTRVYLIDGKGDEIEGSERKFKQSWNDVSNDDFIELPRVDFKKADLRKGYVLLHGVKWAKGNLRYDSNVTGAGFQTGWGLTAEQWDYTGYDVKTSTVSDKTYTYDDTNPVEMRITRTTSRFDHFNYGGIGKFSYDNVNYMTLTTGGADISGKLYSDAAGTTEVSGNARFESEGTDAPTLYGDLPFWASKGQYRLPNADDMAPIHNVTSKIFGYHVVGDVKIWGLLFRYPDLGHDRDSDKAANDNKEFTKADLETGLFFPRGGRVARTNPDVIINQRVQSVFRSSYFVRTNGTRYFAAYYLDKFYNSFDGNNKDWDAPAGFMIRPVLVETAE